MQSVQPHFAKITMTEANSLCQYLDWDSEFFGCRIARITMNSLNGDVVERIMKWCHVQAIDCLYFFATSNDVNTVRFAEANGFNLVDVRITFQKQLAEMKSVPDQIPDITIRLSTPDDIPVLKTIARKSYTDSRFYYDPNFLVSCCETLYETWIEKSCSGYADVVLVADFQGQPVGYVSCHLSHQGTGQIGLVGISPGIRGRGVGKNMMYAALYWFAEHGMQEATVVTQGRNIRAQRLYQKCGFLTDSVQFVYHRWFKGVGEPREYERISHSF